MVLNFDKLAEELTYSFALHEYQERFPLLQNDFTKEAIDYYREDIYFHNRVDSIVTGIIGIIHRHIAA